jgi:sporulation protein YlmC with PRC-barrel domain
MPKFLAGSALAATLLMLGPAFAQAPPTAADLGMPQFSGFLPELPAGSMRLSKIVGTPVIGLDHHAIGKIDEVLLSRDGKVEAVVIGAGGVLGIGGKNVAVPYDAVLWNTGDVTRAPGPSASLSPADAPPQPPTGGAERMPGANVSTEALRASNDKPNEVNPATGTIMTGSTERATVPVVGSGGGPAQAMVRLTKAEIENARAFRYEGEAGQDAATPRR